MYIANPKLMSALGSVFTILPLGNVMDITCGIVADIGQDQINDDIRLNTNGTIFENVAQVIEKKFQQALDEQMTSRRMISSVTVVVDRTNNIQSTSEVKITITVYARGYVLSESIVIGFGTSSESAAA